MLFLKTDVLCILSIFCQVNRDMIDHMLITLKTDFKVDTYTYFCGFSQTILKRQKHDESDMQLRKNCQVF